MSEYSILVVDDEDLARKSTLNLIDWSKLDIHEVYQAEDGYKALDIIKSHSPDIIILDLKMPEISGMDLIEIMISEKLDAQIIVLSGVQDFRAAQKMLEAGKVVSYLLKPISEDLLVEAVVKCIEQIEEKKQVSQTADELFRIKEKIRIRELRDIILGLSDESVDEFLVIGHYSSMCMAVVQSSSIMTDLVEFCLRLKQEPESGLAEVIPLRSESKILLLFAQALKDNGFDNQIFASCKKISNEYECVTGIGRIIDSIFDLNVSYREALLACEIQQLVDENPVSFDSINFKQDRSSNYKSLVENIRKIIMTGDINTARQYFDDLIKIIIIDSYAEIPKNPKELSNLSVIKLRFASFFDEIFIERKEYINLLNVYIANSIEQIVSAATQVFLQGCQHYSYDKLQGKRTLVNLAMQYIDQNYMDHITLNNVAQKVYINPSYLSRLFTEVSEQTFIGYLTTVRLNKAKELLKERSKKIFEVAEIVGYNSFKHFIKVFKDNEGITPAQYRENHMFD